MRVDRVQLSGSKVQRRRDLEVSETSKITSREFYSKVGTQIQSFALEIESTNVIQQLGFRRLENIIDEVESDWLEPWFLSTAYIEDIPFLEAPAGDLNFLRHFSS